MLCCNPPQTQSAMRDHPKTLAVRLRNVLGNEHPTLFRKADQEAVKQRIQIGAEQKSVVDVEPLGIGGALRPRLGVAGAQGLRQGQPGHGAGAAPIVHHGLAVGLLAHPLAHHAQHFGVLRYRWRQLR